MREKRDCVFLVASEYCLIVLKNNWLSVSCSASNTKHTYIMSPCLVIYLLVLLGADSFLSNLSCLFPENAAFQGHLGWNHRDMGIQSTVWFARGTYSWFARGKHSVVWTPSPLLQPLSLRSYYLSHNFLKFTFHSVDNLRCCLFYMNESTLVKSIYFS